MNRFITLLVVATILQITASFQVASLGRIRTNLKSTILDDAISTDAETRSLPPMLQNIADERREFEVNLGKAMDTLRKDYPNMHHKQPGKKREDFKDSIPHYFRGFHRSLAHHTSISISFLFLFIIRRFRYLP